MIFLYCFGNASLAQRVLTELRQPWRSHLRCATVIFLNDFWIVRLIVNPSLEQDICRDWQAFLSENGMVYRPTSSLRLAFDDLDVGVAPTVVMHCYNVAIVSHGMANPAEIRHFQENVVAGLGYRPPSLV